MPGRELSLLSLDGGGIRGLSSLHILKQLMERVRVESRLDTPPKPCDYFDMIGGTSTGGIIAIMLGRLKMTVDECISSYADLSDRVFKKMHHRVKVGSSEIQAQFDSSILEKCIKEVIVRMGFQEDELLKDTQDQNCKVFVCAMNQRTSEIDHLSSYQRSRGGGDRLRAVKIWEAARATSAATSFFDPISINMGGYIEYYVDGATGANNPVNELWKEAKDVWDSGPLEYNLMSLVSIGTGVPSVEPFRTGLLDIGRSLVRISTETERTAESFQRDHSELDDNYQYFRFNVRNGLEHIGLEDASQKNGIMTLTERYVQSQDVFKLMKRCGKLLTEREIPTTFLIDQHSVPHTCLIRRENLDIDGSRSNNKPSRDLFAKISAYNHVQAHRRLSKKRSEGTGRWFLENAYFQTWLNKPDHCALWCSGIVGSGKTTIATMVVDAAIEKSRRLGQAIAYFYCESAPRNILKAAELLKSLIKQTLIYLVATQHGCPRSVMETIRENHSCGGVELDLDELKHIFAELFQYKYLDTATYIIDGLDELECDGIAHVLRVFHDLFQKSARQKLFISSRNEPHYNIDIINMIPNILHLPMKLENSEDVRYFIKKTIADKSKYARKLTEDHSLAEEMASRLHSGAKGMFLWVELQIEALWNDCFTDKDIRSALANLPKDLHATYRRCLERITRNGDTDHALKVFKWVGCASRPLHIDELQEATAFTLTDRKWEPGRTQNAKLIIGRCANLVVMDTDDQHVRFTHPSVLQYLTEPGNPDHAFHIEYDKAQLECAELSVNYLNFSDFCLQLQAHGRKLDNFADPFLASTKNILGKAMHRMAKFRRRILTGPVSAHVPAATFLASAPDKTRYKFLSYAGENWANDSKSITKESQVWNHFKSLALRPNASWKLHPWHWDGQSYQSHLHGLLAWAVRNNHVPLFSIFLDLDSKIKIHELCRKPFIEDGLPALHLAARLGYEDMVRLLLKVPGINKLDRKKRTAMHYAAEKGHKGVTEMLLKARGPDVEKSSRINPTRETPLLLSAKHGHVDVVQLLLDFGHHDNRPDAQYRSSLFWAATNGHEAVVEFLLNWGCQSLNVHDVYGQTPLLGATRNGHVGVTNLLLGQKDIKINVKDYEDHSPLSWALKTGKAEMVKILLKRKDIELNTSLVDGLAPLWWAVKKEDERLVELLLERDDIALNAVESIKGQTPLIWAVELRKASLVKLLLKRDNIEVNAKDFNRQTALFGAIQNPSNMQEETEQVMKLLLTRDDIDVNVQNGSGETPLITAVIQQNTSVVLLLLQRNDIVLNMKDKEGLTAFAYVMRYGTKSMMHLFLKRDDIKVNAKDHYDQTSLFYMINRVSRKEETKEMLKLLLTRDDVDVNVQNASGQTPLMWAIEHGTTSAATLLLKRKDIDIDVRDTSNRTAFTYVMSSGSTSMMTVFLKAKVFNHQTLLFDAINWLSSYEENPKQMMKLLLTRDDIDVNVQNGSGQTPLMWAIKRRKTSVVELLLEQKDIDLDVKDNEGRTAFTWIKDEGTIPMKTLFHRFHYLSTEAG